MHALWPYHRPSEADFLKADDIMLLGSPREKPGVSHRCMYRKFYQLSTDGGPVPHSRPPLEASPGAAAGPLLLSVLRLGQLLGSQGCRYSTVQRRPDTHLPARTLAESAQRCTGGCVPASQGWLEGLLEAPFLFSTSCCIS